MRSLSFFSIPQFAFHSTFIRAWELFRCIAAIYISNYVVDFKYKKILINIVFWNFISLLFFREFTPHPSLITAIPLIFTVIILIFNNENEKNILFLNSKFYHPLDLCFSLYLWHQPF